MSLCPLICPYLLVYSSVCVESYVVRDYISEGGLYGGDRSIGAKEERNILAIALQRLFRSLSRGDQDSWLPISQNLEIASRQLTYRGLPDVQSIGRNGSKESPVSRNLETEQGTVILFGLLALRSGILF